MLFDRATCYPVSKAFSRQQVQERTGIADDVLAFWMKQGLLVPLPAEPRAHRRFSFAQLHVAMFLNSLRSLGVNVGVLRQFADLFQTGLREAEAAELSASELSAAIRLNLKLAQFASGRPVRVRISADDWGKSGTAETERDIVQSWFWEESRDGASDAGAEYAQRISGSLGTAIDWALQLTSAEHLMLEGDNAWVAWQDASGIARLAHDDEVSLHNEDGPLGAFYVPISRLIRKLWPERVEPARQRRVDQVASLLCGLRQGPPTHNTEGSEMDG